MLKVGRPGGVGIRVGGFSFGIVGYLVFGCAEECATEEVDDEFLKRRESRLTTVRSSRLNDNLRRAEIAPQLTRVDPCLTDKDGRDGFRRMEKLSWGRRVAMLFCSVIVSKGVGWWIDRMGGVSRVFGSSSLLSLFDEAPLDLLPPVTNVFCLKSLPPTY